MANYEFMLTDSLEKVFPDKRPERRLGKTITALGGERISMQLAYYMEYGGCELKGICRGQNNGIIHGSILA